MPPSINQASQISTRTGILTVAGTALAVNANRRWFIVQNLGTNPLFVKYGSAASSSDFDVALKAGTGADDGTGGTVTSDSVVYTGIITVGGSSPRFTATEI